MSDVGIHEAMLAFHRDPPHVPLNGRNPAFKNSKFATLPDTCGVVRPALAALGCYFSQPLTTGEDGAPAIITAIIHAPSGESIEYPTPLLLGGKSDPQAWGSAITYARRYGLLSILGLVGDEDDDANAAMPTKAAPVTARADTGSVATNGAPGDDSITPAQNRMLGALVNELSTGGIVDVEKDLRPWMAENLNGKTSRASLTKAEAGKLIDWLTGQKAAAGL